MPEKDRWQVGECIESSEKALTFSHEYCYDVLGRLASEFNTEWEITGKTIHLRKVESNKDAPLPLSYGKGNGFKTGIGRQTQGDKPPVTLLYVQGGERNIDEHTYGNKTLLLPKSATLQYEDRTYRTDAYGMFIERTDRIAANKNEDSFDASHIYPRWEGVIDRVVTFDTANHVYEFKIEKPGQQPDFTNTRVPNEKVTVIFQSGQLTGQEFELAQTDETITGYNHAQGLFQLLKLETDGTTLPNDHIKFAKGDRLGVFHIQLPPEYICDNANKSGGSWEMFREAARYMYEHEEEQFSFTGELDGIWAKTRWNNIGAKLIPGSYIQFSDTQFQPEGIRVRITGVKDYINNPMSPEIELSNMPVGGFVSTDIGKIDSNKAEADDYHRDAIQYTKRRWRDTTETLSMLEKAVDGFSEGIRPIWVQAMSVLVGDESLQFNFVRTANTNSVVGANFYYNKSTKQLEVTYSNDTSIKHYTIGKKELGPEGSTDTATVWRLPNGGFTSGALYNKEPLYLYIKCYKISTSTVAEFELSPEPIQLSVGSYYYFLAGTLSSEYEGERSFVHLYGFTEILPGRINVNKIVSPEGEQYWDMENRAFKIGDANNYLGYNFDNYSRNKLVLKGAMVQRPGEEPIGIGVYREAWASGKTYYPGDDVSYQGSTYRCLIQHSNIAPTNVYHWTPIAVKGEPGAPGAPGEQGDPGALPTIKQWKNGETYVRNNKVVDYIMYRAAQYDTPTWWRVKEGYASARAGSTPTSNGYFEQISSYESIATNVLLSNSANLAGFTFLNEWLRSSSTTDGVPNLQINGKAGEIKALKGNFGEFIIGKKTYKNNWYRGGELDRPNLAATDNIEYIDAGQTINFRKRIDLGGTAIIMNATRQGTNDQEGKWGGGEIMMGPGSIQYQAVAEAGGTEFSTPVDTSLHILSKRTKRFTEFGINVILYNERGTTPAETHTKYHEEFGRSIFFKGSKRIYNRQGDTFRTIELGSHAFQHETWDHKTYIRMDHIVTNHQTIQYYDLSGNKTQAKAIGTTVTREGKTLKPRPLMWDENTGYIYAHYD